MKIHALRLHNVRRFGGRGIAIENIGDGVNVLCAANEAGKSTCFDALHALFFQPHSGTPGAVQALRPYSGGSPLIEADIAVDGRRLRLTKQFYAGKRASVTDLSAGLLVAQADEAERLIAGLVHGGTSGPAGLLWLRQGVTGLEKRADSDEKRDKLARESVLTSVQGEVEALTGGRRMAEVTAACEAELSRYVTATGKPKEGGPYKQALKRRDDLVQREARLRQEVHELREALESRRKAQARLAEIERPEEAQARRAALGEAENHFNAARAHGEKLQRAETETALTQSLHDKAQADFEAFRALLTRAADLAERHTLATAALGEAEERQGAALAQLEAAERALEAAEQAERTAGERVSRAEALERARAAALQRRERTARLAQAEAARKAQEEAEAAFRRLAVPDADMAALEAVEHDLAKLRAAEAAQAPILRMDYEPGAEGKALMDGAPLAGARDLAIPGGATIRLAGIGTLALRTRRDSAATERLAVARSRRQALLAGIGVADPAEAAQRQRAARDSKAEADLARSRLALHAPQGLAALRAEIADLAAMAEQDIGEAIDPAAARADRDKAAERLTGARHAARAARAVADEARTSHMRANTAFGILEAERASLGKQLAPVSDRAGREAELGTALAAARQALAAAKTDAQALRASAPDLANAEAALRRARSAFEALAQEAAGLREHLAALSGRISTRAGDAIEEQWQEAREAREAAEAEVLRLEREVALLTRLRDALQAAHSAAHEHYFAPVMRELQPLLGLLFDDADVVFDGGSLLPRTVKRNGQIEEVERLSGGMREQLAVLTRLAFARLLARDGRPAPVILDDALVYSDDDRIERMFDALHRQSRDQQIIVFSCRQRAFARLGGHALQMADWSPSPA